MFSGERSIHVFGIAILLLASLWPLILPGVEVGIYLVGAIVWVVGVLLSMALILPIPLVFSFIFSSSMAHRQSMLATVVFSDPRSVQILFIVQHIILAATFFYIMAFWPDIRPEKKEQSDTLWTPRHWSD